MKQRRSDWHGLGDDRLVEARKHGAAALAEEMRESVLAERLYPLLLALAATKVEAAVLADAGCEA